MNWDAVTGVAELIGATGVIASLVYVGLQIRQNTIATQRSNARQTASDHARAFQGIQDEQISDIFYRGTEDLETLRPVERYRADLAMAVSLEAIEQAFADYHQQDFPKDYLATYRNRIPGVLNSPGGILWWQQRKAWFSQSFRDDVEELLANPPPEAVDAGVKPPTK